MKISAQDLESVLHCLPVASIYQNPLVNMAVQGGGPGYSPVPHSDLRVVTFHKRETPTHVSFWELEIT